MASSTIHHISNLSQFKIKSKVWMARQHSQVVSDVIVSDVIVSILYYLEGDLGVDGNPVGWM